MSPARREIIEHIIVGAKSMGGVLVLAAIAAAIWTADHDHQRRVDDFAQRCHEAGGHPIYHEPHWSCLPPAELLP